jgi:hypothetical protein
MRSRISALLVAAFAFGFASGAAQAEIFPLEATLDGSQEVPSNNSLAIGVASVTYDNDDPAAPIVTINCTVPAINMVAPIGLDDLTASPFHIHRAPPGVNGPIMLALGTNLDWQENPPQAGGGIVRSYMMTLTAANFGSGGLNPNFDPEGCTDFQACLGLFAAALLSDGSYLNLHTMTFPGGEIRGQILPEPGAAALATAACLTLTTLSRARRARVRS